MRREAPSYSRSGRHVPGKNLRALSDGGGLTTNDHAVAGVFRCCCYIIPNLSIGSQGEVDRARFEVERLEAQISSRNLLNRQQQKPSVHRMNNVPPDASAAEISTNAVQKPIGRGATGRVPTQTVLTRHRRRQSRMASSRRLYNLLRPRTGCQLRIHDRPDRTRSDFGGAH
jgi:hypothetical protein